WPFSKKIKAHCHFNELLVRQILKIEQKSVFLDSSKVIDHALLLSLIDSFDFYIIWLSRDPRAQSHSALKYNPWSIEEAARRWKKEMAVNEKILKKANIKYLPLQYEALCKNPKKEMTRLLQFVGLDANLFSLDFREKEQHIMGNASMRLGKDRKIVERKDWMEKLSQDQIKTIETITADYRHYYAATD
ncbi:MAG: sulfotransferase, partial [Bacteroidota bacterium]